MVFFLTAVFYSCQIRQNTFGEEGGHIIRRRRRASRLADHQNPERSTHFAGPGVSLAPDAIIRIIIDGAVPLKNQIGQALSDN